MNLSFWLRYAVRSLRRSGRRALFALICVAVGVAGVVALQTASLTVQNALTSNVRAANGGDISVTSQESPLSASDLGEFAALQRQGRITKWTAVATVRATAAGTKRQLVPFDVQIVRAPPYPVGGQPTFVSPSNGNVAQLLRHPGDVLVSAVLVDELGVGVGGRIRVNGLGGAGLDVTVRGILSETSFEHSAIMTVTYADASRLTNRVLTYSAVYVDVPGSNAGPVATTLRGQFPLATVTTVQDALQQSQLEVHDFHQFLLLVALFALLIAGVGILNAMQSILAWRRLEIAMLKAMGYRHGTLYALFGVEAALLGLAGGIVGTFGGVIVSREIADALARALAIQVNYQVDGPTLAGGVALGVGATLIFAVLPIVRAASFRPLEILRQGGNVSPASWPATLGLLVVVLALFAALAAIIVGDGVVAVEFVGGAALACAVLTGIYAGVVAWVGRLGPPASRAAAALVLILLIVGTAFVSRREPSAAAILALVTLLWAATMFLPRNWLLTLLVAARSLSRRRSRTAVTLVAFLAGILAMTVTMTVALSLQGQINSVLASAGKINLVAIAGTSDQARVLHVSRTLPGVKSIMVTSFVNTTATRINGVPVSQIFGPAPSTQTDEGDDRTRVFDGVTGFNLVHGDSAPGIRIVSGRGLRPSDVGTNHVVVTVRAADVGLHPGDRVTLKSTSSSRTRTVQVVGFYSRPRAARGFSSFFLAPVLGDRALAQAIGGPDAQSIVNYVVDKNQLTQDAATIQAGVPGALVVDIGDLSAVVETVLGELLNLLAVITALVLGAGIAVVANGVALAMFEQRREIALYKAVGFSPGSVLRFVLVENVLVGTIAGVTSVLGAAIALGLLSRLALQRAIDFDPIVAVYVLAAAVALAVVTSYLAARSPVRVRPLEALRNE